MLRSSPDGRRWEPSVSLPDVWDRHSQKGAHPPGFLTTPDVEDPPDLEFYSGNGFWYHDRAYIPLQWGDASARSLAGRTVRLRFLLRSADLYAVTTSIET